jgi:Large eukaryotic DNA virus major capsid protein/Major capsid protein N-terminus
MTETWPFPVIFGDDTSIPIPINGDIVDTIYLKTIWPTQDQPVNNSYATAMINFVELQYEGTVIERIYGESIFILNDLTVPQGLRPSLSALVGTDSTVLQTEYYLKLPFTFKPPLCALNAPVTLRIVFANFGTTPINLSYVINYVFLSDLERMYFRQNVLSYPVETFQVLQFTINPNETYFKAVTSFVNNVKEFFFVIQDQRATDYNYDIQQYRLSLNGIEILGPNVANGLYLSVIQPLQNHTRTPSSNIYMYSFALDPESLQPSGEANLTYLYNQQHEFWINSSTNTRYLRIYAVSYNIATVQDGGLTMLHSLYESGFKN